MPVFDRQGKRKPWIEQLRLVETLNAVFRGRDARKKGNDDAG